MFDAWRQESWDVNDTLLIADPRDRPRRRRSLPAPARHAPGAFTSWHDQRIGGTLGAGRASASGRREEGRSRTPRTPRGRALRLARPDCLASPTTAAAAATRRARPATPRASRWRSSTRSAGASSSTACASRHGGGGFTYVAGRDLAGQRALPQRHGRRRAARALATSHGNPIRAWDARGHAVRAAATTCCAARRTATSRANGDDESLLERTIYGEGIARAEPVRPAVPPLRPGRPGQQRRARLQGQPRSRARASSPPSTATDRLDGARGPRPIPRRSTPPPRRMLIDADRFSAHEHLRRAQPRHPDRHAAQRGDEAERHPSRATTRRTCSTGSTSGSSRPRRRPGCSIPRPPTLHAVTAIDYDAHGQRTAITYGNGDGHDVRATTR